MIYIIHIEKKIKDFYSDETNKLLEYFSNKKEIIEKSDNEQKEEKKINRKIINLFENFIKIIEETKIDRNKIKNVMDELQKSIKYLENYDNIFIPFLGPSNSGKSTIINGIIGNDILPTNLNECTKKGIIISYCESETITIRNVKFEKQEYLGEVFHYLKMGEIIGRGKDQVKQTLSGLNYKLNEKKKQFFLFS